MSVFKIGNVAESGPASRSAEVVQLATAKAVTKPTARKMHLVPAAKGMPEAPRVKVATRGGEGKWEEF